MQTLNKLIFSFNIIALILMFAILSNGAPIESPNVEQKGAQISHFVFTNCAPNEDCKDSADKVNGVMVLVRSKRQFASASGFGGGFGGGTGMGFGMANSGPFGSSASAMGVGSGGLGGFGMGAGNAMAMG